MMKVIETILVPVHRAGWPFLAVFAAVTLLMFALFEPLGWIGALLTAWCAYFFRDPERFTPVREGLVIAPADGVVQEIRAVPPPAELDMGDAPLTRVAIFMNVFDVHVNRAPVGGTVKRIAYRPGKFFNADMDKASEHNERLGLVIALPDGRGIPVVQIAGLVARRIICDMSEGDDILTGERFGMIRFGSRVDVYLPEGVAPLVAAGQRAVAGETVIADLSSGEAQRLGEARP